MDKITEVESTGEDPQLVADGQVKTGRGKEGFRALCGGCLSRVSAGKERAGTPLPPGHPRGRRGGWARKAAGRGRAVLPAAGGAVRALGPGRERSSCLKGRRGTWLGRSSRPPGGSSEAGRLSSASAAAPRRAAPRRAAPGPTGRA
ncbi:hypothetical protein J1605_009430 [Eschrichtius robustus]|uniref:Uncharacterized protein n=1 Tax=Eschrichtius robustus TaxID=9764 RepID=A0AB34GQN5_ESCRO|nr:hypothetical protein J1605_009430 [Eschrichtius robustus]